MMARLGARDEFYNRSHFVFIADMAIISYLRRSLAAIKPALDASFA